MKQQSQSYREEICWSWKSVYFWWGIIKRVKDGTQMHEKQEMSQQHVCKLRQRSRWKEWGKCRSTDWRTRENRWKYSVLFFLQFIRCLIQSALFTDVWNWFSFSILRTISALQHTGGIAISYCCATGGTLHTWDGRISLDLKQFFVVRACTQAQSGHNANLWCQSEACSISQKQNIFK